MNLQSFYWNFLCELKARVSYLEEYHRSMDVFARAIKIFVTLASSGSILGGIIGWFILHTVPGLWLLVIAFLQAGLLIKDHLPYENRRKSTNNLKYSLKDLFTRAEKEWYYVSKGELPYEKINELLYNMKKEINTFEKAFINEDALPIKNRFANKAQIGTEQYFKRYI